MVPTSYWGVPSREVWTAAHGTHVTAHGTCHRGVITFPTTTQPFPRALAEGQSGAAFPGPQSTCPVLCEELGVTPARFLQVWEDGVIVPTVQLRQQEAQRSNTKPGAMLGCGRMRDPISQCHFKSQLLRF